MSIYTCDYLDDTGDAVDNTDNAIIITKSNETTCHVGGYHNILHIISLTLVTAQKPSSDQLRFLIQSQLNQPSTKPPITACKSSVPAFRVVLKLRESLGAADNIILTGQTIVPHKGWPINPENRANE